MRVLIALLLVSLLAFGVWAVDLQLNAGARDQPVLDIYNCGLDGTTTKLEIVVNVENPVGKLLNVHYSYYNFTSQSFVDSADFCSIPPGQSLTCNLKFPVALGNRGNGTLNNVELLRLKADDPTGPNTYSKSLYFNITHTESVVEANVKSKLVEFAKLQANATASIPCEGQVCCGMLEAKSALAGAEQSHGQAVSKLSECSGKDAYSLSVSAVNQLKDAATLVSEKSEECSAALSEYAAASDAFNSAKKAVSEQTCDTSESAALLANAEGKLDTVKTRLSSDQYSTVSLEAADVKSLAGMAEANPCKGIITIPPGGDQNTSGTGGTGGTQAQQAGKLCPLFLLLFPAFAYAAFRRSG
ncbi:MAG: hypothetical protein NT157_03730 [Candidatus Micrarchaeota archaeon]|nr:hypothetical protein [Candidatus Micrarchaeota archaeon]